MSVEFVTIAMPALNEEAYIASAIASLIPTDGEIDYEILVLDGGSVDATCDIVKDLARQNPKICLIHNPKRFQSSAINLAAGMCDPRSRYLVRADCHSSYPDGFVVSCVETLRGTGAASVVVPMRTVGRTCTQRAIAAAQNSALGNGGAAHRQGGTSGFVDHGHHAAFVRSAFLEVGGYDEAFTHNEDAEFDQRLISAGHKIYLADALGIVYFPRRDLIGLARQYVQFGSGRAENTYKHATWPKLRQLLPVVALLGCVASIVGAFFWAPLAAIAVAYVAGCLVWGGLLAIKTAKPCLAISGLAAVVMHMSWAGGYLWRILSLWGPHVARSLWTRNAAPRLR